MTDTPERKRPFRTRSPGGGRKSKGPRYSRTIRFPVDLHEAIEDAALAAGYDNVNDYVVAILERARAAGLFPPAAPGQPPLPISA